MSEHTPTPWQRKSAQHFHIYGPDDEWCATGQSSILRLRALANAEFIVRAANSHQPLVDALTDTLAFVEGYAESADEDDPVFEMLPRWQAVIKAARGEE